MSTTSSPHNTQGTRSTNNAPHAQSKDKHCRPTHFLSLPLVSATSLPQLAKSVALFQNMTTAPRPPRPSEVMRLERERAQRIADGEAAADDVAAGQGEDGKKAEEDDSLKIIPEAAHRAPGTLHLTLGTMVLGDEEAMRRAVWVLRETDFRGLLWLLSEGPTGDPGEDEGIETSGEADVKEQQSSVVERGQHSDSLMDAAEDVAASIQTLRKPISPPPLSSSGASPPPPSEGAPNTTSTLQDPTLPIISSSPSTTPPPPPLRITLHSLAAFPQSSRARVFYAIPHDPTRRLQPFAEAIAQKFVAEGVVTPEDRKLTLHATIANLKYVKSWMLGSKKWDHAKVKRGAHRQSRRGDDVDGRGVVRVFKGEDMTGGRVSADGEGPEGGDGSGSGVGWDAGMGKPFVWAEDVLIDRVRICKMGAVESEDEVAGMEYPPIRVRMVDGDDGEGELAEVRL